MKPIKEERRRFTRFGMDAKGHLLQGTNHWSFHLIDVCLKGALISIPGQFNPEIGESCRVEFTLPGSGIVISMEGCIAHREGHHIGFRCEMIDVDSLSHLKRLVEMNLGDQKILERELAQLIQV